MYPIVQKQSIINVAICPLLSHLMVEKRQKHFIIFRPFCTGKLLGKVRTLASITEMADWHRVPFVHRDFFVLQ